MTAPGPGWEGGRLYSPAAILARPCPIPARAGLYGWFFATIPPGIDAAGTCERDGSRLLYVGISPRRATSSQTLRSRLRAYCRGDAYGSTLRLTVGCLLADELGIELRRIGGGARETFGPGEAVLSEWIAPNMRVSFREDPEPWVAEAAIIGALDLPLNIEQNAHNPQRQVVRKARARCKAHARALPVLPR
jgi:GIY-YIG catalytic domain-containing protein